MKCLAKKWLTTALIRELKQMKPDEDFSPEFREHAHKLREHLQSGHSVGKRSQRTRPCPFD